VQPQLYLSLSRVINGGLGDLSSRSLISAEPQKDGGSKNRCMLSRVRKEGFRDIKESSFQENGVSTHVRVSE